MYFGQVRSLACWPHLASSSTCAAHDVLRLCAFATHRGRRRASRLQLSIPVTFKAADRTLSTLVRSPLRHLSAKANISVASSISTSWWSAGKNHHRSLLP